MKTILNETFNTPIQQQFTYKFSVSETALYLIEITASAKSWSQNLYKMRSLLKADKLAVKIDHRDFSQFKNKNKFFDSEAAWNGNILKGFSKTNVFAIQLQAGEHLLNFSSYQNPILESVTVYQIENLRDVSYKPQFNLSEEYGTHSWFTIIISDLSLKNLNIAASAQSGKSFLRFKRDDSDLKLVINGEIQKNSELKSHRYWYWCGRTLKGNTKTFSKEFSEQAVRYYIEFWADRNPIIENITMEILPTEQNNNEDKEFTLDDVTPYIYKGVSKDEDYNRFDTEIIDAVNYWNNYFEDQKYPPSEPLHPNLVKAMMYIESRMGYYEAKERYYEAYPDVMQVGDPKNPALISMKQTPGYDANEFISEDEYGNMSNSYFPQELYPNVETSKESIFWGVRWLYHKAQYLPQITIKPYVRKWRTWKDAVQSYNQKGATDYSENIYSIYLNGLDIKDKTNPIKLWAISLLILGLSVSGIIFGVRYLYRNDGRLWVSYEEDTRDVSGFEKAEYILTANLMDGFRTKKVAISSHHKYSPGRFNIVKESSPDFIFYDLFRNDDFNFIVSGKDFRDYEVRYVVRETKDGLEIIPNIDKYGKERPAFESHAVNFWDEDKDGIVEVKEAFYLNYSNAPDQVWYTWYKYNTAKGLYEFLRIDKEEAKDWWWL